MTKKVKLAIICSAAAVCVIAVVLTVTLVLCLRKDPVKYSVFFDTRGGSEIAPYSLEEGDKIARPTNPTKEMFIFNDWYTDTTYTVPFEFGSGMPAHNITVYAGWIGEASVKITYNANGGLFDGNATEYSVSGLVGATYTAPDKTPTRTGYVFDKWYTDEQCTVAFTSDVYPVDDVTLYAGWGADASYSYVSFYGNGELLTVVPVEKGSAVTDPELFGAELESNGWFKNAEMTEPYTFGAADRDISLYTSYYTRGLVIDNGKVVDYSGASTEIVVPEKFNGTTVTEVGEKAFYVSAEYGRITKVVLPKTITTIADGAFYDCRYLESVNLTENVTSIGANAFYGNKRLKSFGDISSVTSIGDAAFLGCGMLKNIVLSEKLTVLGAYAFSGCSELTEIVIPSIVNAIEEYAFSDCAKLSTVDIASPALKYIAGHAFDGCYNLVGVTIRSVDTTEFSGSVGGVFFSPFKDCRNVKIYVPSETVERYKSYYGHLDDNTLEAKFVAIP